MTQPARTTMYRRIKNALRDIASLPREIRALRRRNEELTQAVTVLTAALPAFNAKGMEATDFADALVGITSDVIGSKASRGDANPWRY